MTYIQFLTLNMSGEVWDMSGDRGVVILDGRETMATWQEHAKEYMAKPTMGQVVGYVIYKGAKIKDGNTELYRSPLKRKKFIPEIEVPVDVSLEDFQAALQRAIFEFGCSQPDGALGKATIIEIHKEN